MGVTVLLFIIRYYTVFQLELRISPLKLQCFMEIIKDKNQIHRFYVRHFNALNVH